MLSPRKSFFAHARGPGFTNGAASPPAAGSRTRHDTLMFQTRLHAMPGQKTFPAAREE
jgi:hypothetical protein